MYEWLTGMLGEENATYALYGLGALAVLVVVWVLRFWIRRTPGGVFLGGNRGKQPRLAVVDAAAVDSHRRIVLVRRDNVEHLVMIGGHNDLVIERNIGKTPDSPPPPETERTSRQHKTEVADSPASAAKQAVEVHPPSAQSVLREEPKRPLEPRPAATPPPAPVASPKAATDATEIRRAEPVRAQRSEPVVEMPGAYAEQRRYPPRDPDDKSLENEMQKLLSELSDDK
jgi:hypothetical protein